MSTSAKNLNKNIVGIKYQEFAAIVRLPGPKHPQRLPGNVGDTHYPEESLLD
jgi:hypothetical protein